MLSSYLPFTLVLGVIVAGGVALYDSQSPSKAYPEIALNEVRESNGFSGWIEFISAKNNFKTFFPAIPQYVEQNIEDPDSQTNHHYEMFVAEQNNGSVYMVNIISYGKDFKLLKPQVMLDDVIKKMQKNNENNKLAKSEDTTFNNFPAKRFQFDQDKLTILGCAFIVDNKVYVISYIAKNGQVNREEFDHFLNSFKYTSESNETPAIKA